MASSASPGPSSPPPDPGTATDRPPGPGEPGTPGQQTAPGDRTAPGEQTTPGDPAAPGTAAPPERGGSLAPADFRWTGSDQAPARLVVLVSGSGSNLQALLDAVQDAGAAGYGAEVVAVGADRPNIAGLQRAERAGLPTFVRRVRDHDSRDSWDRALTEATAEHAPDLVVSAGFMKIVGPHFMARFGGRFLNTHPALLPSFPGAHGVRDALAYGVKVTGCTVHFVDDGVDTGPIIAQGVVEIRDEDDESALHERIKEVERRLLVDVVGRLARDGYRIQGRKVMIP